MYVVTVVFEIHPENQAEFIAAMCRQAQNSLTLETGCHQFDVSLSEEDTNRVFLYELYTDKAAFQAHLASEHFAEFNSLVSAWVKQKEVSTWLRKA